MSHFAIHITASLSSIGRARQETGVDGRPNRPDAAFVDGGPCRQTSLPPREVPAMYPVRDFAEAGGLTTEPILRMRGVRPGSITGRILKGARPAESPVLQPT